MFGYLTPNRDELRVRELRLYRAHYCGVCRAMKQHCCRALLFVPGVRQRLSFPPGRPVVGPHPIKEARCPFKPWKKLFAVECPAAVYAAKANAYLGYLKCLDDRADEHPCAARPARGSFAAPQRAQRRRFLPRQNKWKRACARFRRWNAGAAPKWTSPPLPLAG